MEISLPAFIALITISSLTAGGLFFFLYRLKKSTASSSEAPSTPPDPDPSYPGRRRQGFPE